MSAPESNRSGGVSDALHDPSTDGTAAAARATPAPEGEPGLRLETYVLTVNGRELVRSTDGWIGESLLYVLRERLGLPGAKNACEQGECGSCSVLLDGVLVRACLRAGRGRGRPRDHHGRGPGRRTAS